MNFSEAAISLDPNRFDAPYPPFCCCCMVPVPPPRPANRLTLAMRRGWARMRRGEGAFEPSSPLPYCPMCARHVRRYVDPQDLFWWLTGALIVVALLGLLHLYKTTDALRYVPGQGGWLFVSVDLSFIVLLDVCVFAMRRLYDGFMRLQQARMQPQCTCLTPAVEITHHPSRVADASQFPPGSRDSLGLPLTGRVRVAEHYSMTFRNPRWLERFSELSAHRGPLRLEQKFTPRGRPVGMLFVVNVIMAIPALIVIAVMQYHGGR